MLAPLSVALFSAWRRAEQENQLTKQDGKITMLSLHAGLLKAR